MSPLRAVSPFTIACESCGCKPRWFSKLDVLRACLSDAGLKVGVPLLLREKLWILDSFLMVGHHTEGRVYGQIVSRPFLSASMCFA